MEVLDVQGACDFLKIAKPTLYKYIRLGKIPAFKVGRIWRFHLSALDEWVRGRVTEDTQVRSRKRNR